ncbi:MAG: hypothetical protein ACOYXW_01680 [Actinomycetota bacterium]
MRKQDLASRRGNRSGLRPLAALFAAILLVDPVRKLGLVDAPLILLIYVATGIILLSLLLSGRGNRPSGPPLLPILLIALTAWCLVNAVLTQVPLVMVALGTATYVFFVPLVYAGIRIAESGTALTTLLRVVSIVGSLVGVGAIISSVLGPSAPVVLRPVAEDAAFHSFLEGNIYLSPSIFVSGEMAAEILLVSLFAWLASLSLSTHALGPAQALLGAAIAVGLLSTARRTVIAAALAGFVAFGLLRYLDSLKARNHPLARKSAGLGPAVVLAVVGSASLVGSAGTDGLVPFLTVGSSEVLSRLTGMFSVLHPFALVGQGIGTSTQGLVQFGAIPLPGYFNGGLYNLYLFQGRVLTAAEGGLAKAWLEIGVTGVLLYAAVFAVVIIGPFRRLRHLDGMGRAAILLVIALSIVFLKGHQSLDNPRIQPLYWIAAGIAWQRTRERTGNAAPRKIQESNTTIANSRGGYPEQGTPSPAMSWARGREERADHSNRRLHVQGPPNLPEERIIE